MRTLDMHDLPHLAWTLWQAGFSQDSFRNWRMAELLLASSRFHELLSDSEAALHSPHPSSHNGEVEYDDEYNRPMAYLLYDLSYALEYPSHDAFVNWVAGLQLWLLPHQHAGRPA